MLEIDFFLTKLATLSKYVVRCKISKKLFLIGSELCCGVPPSQFLPRSDPKISLGAEKIFFPIHRQVTPHLKDNFM